MSKYTTRTYHLNRAEIIPGDNDRTVFNAAELQALADNINENGLLQPIMVRKLTNGQYQIILGERRYRATGLLGWETIPAIIRDVTDEEASAGMLSENMARANLDPIDEAHAYQSRIDRYGWTVEYLAGIAGVSTVRILFRLKLLSLRSDLQALIRSGNLPLGYAQTLADAGLDANHQAIAIDRLRDNANPTPQWFRRECGALLSQQAQVCMFDVFEAAAMEVQPTEAPAEPPLPSTTIPPHASGTPREMLAAHVSFWKQAADAWATLGKSFKRQECQAAAQALETVLALM
jgi:ParB/RepB/Spo0J family partition protein